MATTVKTVRVDESIGEWLDGYADKRGVKVQELLEAAIASFIEDAKAGVPDLKKLIRTHREAMAPKAPGSSTDEADCACPKFENNQRGFRNSCPVHGGKTREDFAKATKARGELFRGLRTPDSIKGYSAAAKKAAGK